MAYSDFTLQEVVQRFQLVLEEQHNLFAAVPEVGPGDFLCAILDENVPLALALSTEKARSELMIAPVLVEVRKLTRRQISLFSGADFPVDATQGLTGVCDFLMARSREQFFIHAPVVVIVEAKNENFKAGMGQCSATMMAAQCFNTREGTSLTTIYGAITTGNVWKFLKLEGSTLFIDLPEYHIDRIGKTSLGHVQPTRPAITVNIKQKL
jgi:hypothetical protein